MNYSDIKKKIGRLLIANRGEPAMRAIKTCRLLGIESVVIYSSYDSSSDWVFAADYAIEIDGADKSNPYLNIELIVDVAVDHSCHAIWPGWGFLAENPEFAKRVIDAGLIWVGPPPDAMNTLGSKVEALKAAREAGFDTLQQSIVSDTKEIDSLKEIEFPVILKPACGGGGQGQRIVRSSDELEEAVEESTRLSESLFKDRDLILQPYLEKTKHIEFQMIGDLHGNICILGTRDCSIQRRNQKIIEEGPVLSIPDSVLEQAYEAARKLFRNAGYSSAGTIEMLLSNDKLYFLEVNTRLQVEHPVTEESTVIRRDGQERHLDILAEMFNISIGNELSFTQDMLSTDGYAIEARLYAEDPDNGFIPTPGSIYFIRFPQGTDIRVDSAIIGPSGEINRDFDPMFAKLIVKGKDRLQTVHRLHEYLKHTVILGITTNIDYLRRITGHPEFESGEYLTNFISTSAESLAHPMEKANLAAAVGCIAAYLSIEDGVRDDIYSPHTHSIEDVLNQFPSGKLNYIVSMAGDNYTCGVSKWYNDRFFVESGDNSILLDVSKINSHIYSVRDAYGKTHNAYALIDNHRLQVLIDGENYVLNVRRDDSCEDGCDPNASPHSGKIVKVFVEPNDAVVEGDELFVIESMKMESVIRSDCSGFVTDVFRSPGDSVDPGESVVRIEPYEDSNCKKETTYSLDFGNAHDELLHSLFLMQPEDYIDYHSEIRLWEKHSNIIKLLPRLFFCGYNINSSTARNAFLIANRFDSDFAVETAEDIVKIIKSFWILGNDDYSDRLLDFAKHRVLPEKISDFSAALSKVASIYGVSNVKNRKEVAKHLPRIFLSTRKVGTRQVEILLDFVEVLTFNESNKETIIKLLTQLCSCSILDLDSSLMERCLQQISSISEQYNDLMRPPVAIEHLPDYDNYCASPLSTLSLHEIGNMRFCVEEDSGCPTSSKASQYPNWFQSMLHSWFDGFRIKELYSSANAQNCGIRFFELSNLKDESDRRLASICFLSEAQAMKDNQFNNDAVEMSMMEAHRGIAQYNILGDNYTYNHMLTILPPGLVWKWDQHGKDSSALSPDRISNIASRITGFTKQSRVCSNEILLNIESDGEVLYHILEIKHVEPKRILCRPPYPISERISETKRRESGSLDEKQLLRGKLLNRDRARLLFDGGQYTELLFPEVDDDMNNPTRLNVYMGHIMGMRSIAYAGDFRLKGGALGEREGKKLAATVVLAFASDIPLIGIHDGAGADIRDSVASLGWAGAYFGAIANSGGFSNNDRFWEWYESHLGKNYFDKVLKHFDVAPIKRDASNRDTNDGTDTGHFFHIHLNLGATVGMLVYGASISAMSIMANHPEIYRVLTGSVAVEKVLGEKASNYELGGAHTHSRYSGDIDISCSSEEDAIVTARKLTSTILKSRTKEQMLPSTSLNDTPPPSVEDSYSYRDMFLHQLDTGSFIETRHALKGSAHLMTGYASIAGTPVGIASHFSPHGIRNPRTLKKLYMQYAGCREFGLPLITFVDHRWYRIPKRAAPRAQLLRAECELLYSQLEAPRISIAMGPESMDEPIHQLADICCYIKDGTETPYDLNRAHILAHIVEEHIEECFKKIALLLPYLLRKRILGVKIEQSRDFGLPESRETPYDTRDVITNFFDQGSFIELQRFDAQPLTVGFATANGNVVGIIADNPSINGGAQTAYSLGKFTRFNRLCERLRIPIIEFNDSPAFQPGKRQERLGIQGEGGQSLREECLGNVPRLAVTLRQNYGGRFIHANLRTLGPNRWAFACDNAQIGVMGAEGAVAVLHRKLLNQLDAEERAAELERLKSEYIETHLKPERARELDYIDRIVALENLQSAIYDWCDTHAK